MIRMKKKVFEKKLEAARRALQSAGLVAPDGSGEPSVEALFVLLRWLEKGELRVEK